MFFHRIKSHMSYCAYSGGTIWLLKNPDTTSSPLETSGKEGASPADTGAICIAKMYSPVTAKSFALPGKWTPQDYVVEIAPGVDQALILAWILAYAEMDDADNH
ncbi:unnamed protein product [Amoebophrya sp. A120]|nr:unnamed protein product [Amoebophrya sp. A120]|eukprot:GSA120T00005894001.1